jgi:PAS domain S-box-containing protein
MDLEIVSLDGDFSLVTFKENGHRLRLESHIQRLITAMDATPDVFLVTDADLRITFVNPAFQSVTGYSMEEVLGRADDFLRAPSEQEKVSAYREQLSRGREWIGELVNRRRNGETYHVESTISPIFDFAGHFMGYVVCERDITVRKRLQDDLRRERDFVQSILQSLDGAIYSLDCQFQLTHANDGWRRLPVEHGGIRLTGTPETGRPLLDYVPEPARRAELQTLFQEVLCGGHPRDNHFHAPDGRHWLVKISPWINGEKMHGLICSITDQTQHHELQNQLFQAQKMEIIGTLAAGVAHDFNNLLQVIRGHTSLILMQTTADSPLRQGLEKVDMAAVRAAEITQQLLSFSRVSDERRIVLDLNKVIREANQLGRRTLRGNVIVELFPTATPIRIKIDPTKASQALLNLCVNAQDAMPDGGRLTLTNSLVKPSTDLMARRNLPPGTVLACCSVTDTGCGIPDEVRPRIFEPFFTTKEKGKGTGLGLPIVQRIAEEAGGFVELESVLGRGTTFHLYLPIVPEQLAPVTAPEHAPLVHGKGRVLVVDDVDLLRDFTQKFLQMTGLNVLVASNGQQALKVLEESGEPVDLLFTDYNMPGMTGLELIEAVVKRWPATKFVLASGFLNDATYTRIKPYHVSILAKPYDMHDASKIVMEKLAEKINRAAHDPASGGAAEDPTE